MTDTSTTPSEVFLPVDGEPLEVRSAMLANGYVPIPLSGKRPLLPGWPEVTVNEQSFGNGAAWGSIPGCERRSHPCWI